jgi:hypothetical protein
MKNGKVKRIFNNREILWYDFTVDVGIRWTIPVKDNRMFTGLEIDVIAELINKNEIYIFNSDTINKCFRFRFGFSEMIFDVQPWEELFAPGIGLIEGKMNSLLSHETTLTSAIINDTPVRVAGGNHEKTMINKFCLNQNYPNPFNPKTTIHYALLSLSHITLNIYNINGQEVKTLIDDAQLAGKHFIEWAGKNNCGQLVVSGIYFVELKTANFSQVIKLTMHH